jgi:hypothetical protein
MAGAGGGASCTVLYVSNTGDDKQTGCDSALPRRTIASALATLDSQKTGGEVRVCAGMYKEPPLQIQSPISLRGGFACDTWQRTTNFGYPMFDGENSVTLQCLDNNADATLTLYGNGVGRSVIVDGLIVNGPNPGTQKGSGIFVRKGASPQISDNQILGGYASLPDGVATAGMRIFEESSPLVMNNKIDGGSGAVEKHAGSAGVILNSTAVGRPYIKGNTISGGSGQSASVGSGSVGLLIVNDATCTLDPDPKNSNPIEGNTILGGSGTSADSSGAIGVSAQGNMGVKVDLLRNKIKGGTGTGNVSDSLGVSVSGGHVRLLANRVYGGDNGSKTSKTNGGVDISGIVTDVELTNNEIHAGNKAADFLSGPLSFGVRFKDVKFAVARHNTIFSGTAAPNGQSTAVLVGGGSLYLSIDNNILMGSGVNGSVPLLLDSCVMAKPIAPSIVFFRSNLLFNAVPDAGLLRYGTCGMGSFPTTTSLEAELQKNADTQASNNLTVNASCAMEPGCITLSACTPGNACLSNFFEFWKSNSTGYDNLFNNGWLLHQGDPCKVMESSFNDTNQVPDDFLAQKRSMPPSIGAHEFHGSNCSN